MEGFERKRANTERQLPTWLYEKGVTDFPWKKRGIENGNPGVNINGRGKWV